MTMPRKKHREDLYATARIRRFY